MYALTYSDKQAVFQEGREKMMKALANEALSNNDPFTDLKRQVNIERSLQVLISRANGSNFYSSIMKIIDSQLVPVLMHFLDQEIHLKLTLQLIASMINKNQLSIGKRFFDIGLIEYLTKYLSYGEVAHFAMNIICNLSIQSTDYSQLMLLNNVHQIIIEKFINVVNTNNLNLSDEEKEFLKFSIFTLQTYAGLQQTTIDLQRQTDEIAAFCSYVLKIKVLPNESLELLYLLLSKNSNLQLQQIIPALNSIIEQTPANAEYLKTLFLTINKMPTAHLNYAQVFKLMVLDFKIISTGMKILLKLARQRNFQYLIPRDEVWWQKIIEIVDKSDDMEIVIELIEILEPKEEWAWRQIYQALQASQRIQSKALILINKRLESSADNIHFMKKHRIVNQLQILTQNLNPTISHRSCQLLERISNID